MHKKFQPTAKHAWTRIARWVAVYGGEFDHDFYKTLLSQEQCVPAIAELQAMGNVFTMGHCSLWAVEICGSFEVTHPRYVPPTNYDTAPADVLYKTMMDLFGIEEVDEQNPAICQ